MLRDIPLKSEGDRRRAFSKYQTDLIFASGNEALILADKSRLKQIRVNFKMCYMKDCHYND